MVHKRRKKCGRQEDEEKKKRKQSRKDKDMKEKVVNWLRGEIE